MTLTRTCRVVDGCYFLGCAVGGRVPFRRRYMAAAPEWAAQPPTRKNTPIARGPCTRPKSTLSPSLESSTLARDAEQKSNEARAAASNLSLGSVSLNSSTLGAGTSATLEQKPLLDSMMWTTRCPKLI